jgi:hypothetical protein
LVLANKGVPGKWTYFPISETATKYKTESPGKVQGMSPGAVSIINTLQPYQRGNDSYWKLHHLNNIDKHSLLLVAAFGSGVPTVVWTQNNPARSKATGATWKSPPGIVRGKRFPIVQDGTEIGRIHGCGESEVDMEFQLPFEIAFREPKIVEGEPIIPFLHQLASLIDSTVDLFI